jgi:hypothetical protein
MPVILGGGGVFVIHGYTNFTLLNKAIVVVKASYNFTPDYAFGIQLA